MEKDSVVRQKLFRLSYVQHNSTASRKNYIA